MEHSPPTSTAFWAGVLIVSTLLTPILLIAMQMVAPATLTLSDTWGDRRYQTLVYVAAVLASSALLSFRMLIGRALDHNQNSQAYVLAGVCVLGSVGLIAYGVSSFIATGS